MLCLAVRRWHGFTNTTRSAAGDDARQVVATRLEVGEPGAEGFRPFRLALAIEPGWHLYAHEPGHEAAVATRLTIDNGELRAVSYPPSQTTRLGEGGETVAIYEDSVEIRGELRAGEQVEPRLQLAYQACDLERCLLPVVVEVVA